MRRLFFSVLGILIFSAQLLAQNRTITGKITDDKGNGVANASVIVKNTKIGTTTNADGSFSLSVPPTASVLIISSVGSKAQEVAIAGQSTINVTLQTEEGSLSEVVVVGYQTVRKREVVGSVATAAGKEFAEKPLGNFTQILQGKLTGVQVTGQSGRPGANGYIRVRGTGSINASNEPLILLDGVPISSTAYSMINPNDIESVSVLKDAASQAIYGARAANGVLVVTSKKGKGKPELRYSFQYGKSSALDLKNLTLMNSQQKLQYEYEGGFTNPILDSMIANRIALGAFPSAATLFTLTDAQRMDLWNLATSRGPANWADYLLQKGTLTTHEVAINGASDKFRYYLSLNKSNTDGVLYGSNWNKTGGRLNVEYNALDWFRLGSNIGITSSQENNVRSLFNTQNSYAALFLFNPYEPVYLPNGQYNVTHEGYSPLEGTDHNPSFLDRLASFSSFFGEANFFKYLTIKSLVGINYNTLNQENYLQPGSNLANILGYNQKTDAGNRDYTTVWTNTANWKQTLSDKHNINVLAGHEFTKNKFYSFSLAGRNLPSATYTTLDVAGSAQTATTSRSDWSLESWFGQASYDYAKKYFVSVNGRRDGSSRFGANKRWANFWSVGASWDVLKENFFETDFINALKLRASIGTSGTVPSGLYDNLGVYSVAAKYQDQPAAIPLRLENADLTWETNRNWDLGLDFTLLKNRINGTVEYYTRKTENLIYPKNVSFTTGFQNYTANIGNLQNKGIEVSLDGDVIRGKDLKLNLFATYSHNDNKVLKLYSDNVPQTLSRFKEGEPLYTYFLVRWAGINPSNGKNLFYTANGDLTETYSSSDAVLLKDKSPQVKYFGSFGLNLTYKYIDLSTQFYYSGGNYIMNYVWQVGASEGENIADQQFTDAANYWKKPGDIALYANLKDLSQRVTFDTDKYLEKGDYVSLRDVTIGFTLPTNVASKIRLKSVRIFGQGTNLWLGTKFRGLPEVGEANGESSLVSPGLYNLYAQPQLKAYTFGIDVRF